MGTYRGAVNFIDYSNRKAQVRFPRVYKSLEEAEKPYHGCADCARPIEEKYERCYKCNPKQKGGE